MAVPSRRGGSSSDRWSEIANQYATALGWRVLPLHSNPHLARESDDPTIRQLGWLPLVDVPDEASASPDRVREWACYPAAPVAVLTGQGSNLAALEIPHDDGRGPLQGDVERRCGPLPDTRRIVGPDRTYYLFELPGDVSPLPPLCRTDGWVLHGEKSLIRVPSRPRSPDHQLFEWDLFAAEDLALLPDSLREYFDLPVDGTRGPSPAECDRQAFGEASSVREKLPDASFSLTDDGGLPDLGTSGAFPLQNREEQAATEMSSPPPHGATSHSSPPLPFRCGDDLAPAPDGRTASTTFPWLAAGALTLLTGRTKTAGKSTFVVNLAAHLAAGRPFLGRDASPEPVVLLSDLPARPFRDRLAPLDLNATARSRLHVLHPRDVADLSWSYVLDHAFDHAGRVGARLVVIDSLDSFVHVKGGPDPRFSSDVAHALTAGAPADCAVLAVQSLPQSGARMHPDPSENENLPADSPIEGLGLLAAAADVIAHLQDVSGDRHPTLRRLVLAGRLSPLPTHILCEMIRGRYKKLSSTSGGDGVRPVGSLGPPTRDVRLSPGPDRTT